MPSEINQKKEKYHMFSLKCRNLKKAIWNKTKTKVMNIENRLVVAWGAGR